MQRRYTGQWSSKYMGTNLLPYATAEVWGTGIASVHAIHGAGPPVRVMGRPGEMGSAGYDGQEAGGSGLPDQYLPVELWGYSHSDSNVNNYVDYDDRPQWNEQPPMYRGDIDNHPSVGEWAEPFREQSGGAHRYRQKLADALPSETVTEGWRHKPKGEPANSQPSSPNQYEMQTSMRQRYQARNNQHAVDRATDDPREPIHSRVIGQKLKIYSGEERHYDMFPFQQDEIQRPFWYRRAGTGIPEMMQPNEMYASTPFQRMPPPSPPIGNDELNSAEYGYTSEDSSYLYG